jgi:hypothetical protein
MIFFNVKKNVSSLTIEYLEVDKFINMTKGYKFLSLSYSIHSRSLIISQKKEFGNL